MPVLRDTNLPTHVLAAVQADTNSAVPPSMYPIDANLYAHGFRVALDLSQVLPGLSPSTPRLVDGLPTPIISLPVIPITVPHAASLPLLLLFGMSFETQPNLMAWRLLPPQVIEEFPNAAAMSQVFSRLRDDAQFERYVRYNQGLWKNVLALGLRNTRLVELVQTAWNVTAEARRIRQRAQRG